MLLKTGTRLGRYKIHSLIGAGGMGEVYLGEDNSLNRKVALKVLLEKIASDNERLLRFQQEAKTVSALNHPNILTIYEFGTEKNLHYLASEFIDGETLRDLLANDNLSLIQILDMAIQIASALQSAHNAGIIHRDIKPENVMIRKDGYVKILDFGLAKLTENKSIDGESGAGNQLKTREGIIMGTAAYMSPEQARGRAVDKRSDLWSLGVVLYEMVTGRQPFQGETLNHTIVALLEKEPPNLSLFVSDYPGEIERIIKKSLEKDPLNRYQTATEFLTDLKNLQKNLEFEAQFKRIQSPESSAAVVVQDDKTEILESVHIAAPNNLSEALTVIVGREKEKAEIKKLLKEENTRLVTLTGIGGTGKTTLSKAVAKELLNEFYDGIYFIELGTITNPELVISTIAHPLGVKETGGKPILEVLKEFLSDKKILLVIDNFEQIVDSASQISDLLSATNHLKILITSRILLHLIGEREFVVPPLSMPSQVATLSADDLEKYEAIKLFIERARAAKSSFSLTEENAQSVAEICQRLDGLPLAIELAAARVKILSPKGILAKLENRLNLLTGGAKDLPERQQTMRGAVEWSYELLDKAEKTFFRRLAIFAGGFTYEAAETICGNEDIEISDYETGKAATVSQNSNFTIETFEILDLLTSLVDKSLVVSKERSDGEMRFRLLEVVREYALESLEKNSEDETMRRRHAAYYLALAEEAEPHLQGSESEKWLNRLEEEHDNLRAALRWYLENDIALAARLAAAIRSFWTFHTHLKEGLDWLEEIFERGCDVPFPRVRFKLQVALATFARYQGDFEKAGKAYEDCLAEGKAANDLRQVALSNRGLGMVAHARGDLTAARKFINEGLNTSRELNDELGIAYSLNILGDWARMEGDYAEARPLYEESLGIFRKLDNNHAVSENLNNLGAALYGIGDYNAARSNFEEALRKNRKLKDKIGISYSLDGFAALATEVGEPNHAAKLAGAAGKMREAIGYEIEPAEQHFRESYLSKLETKLDQTVFTKNYEKGSKMKQEEAIALALEESISIARTEMINTQTDEDLSAATTVEEPFSFDK